MPIRFDSVDAVRRVLQAHQHVLAAYVFGSRAGGEPRPDSDVDIGVLFDSPQPLEATLRLESALQDVTAERVDLVDVGRAGAFLALAIVCGERIFALIGDGR